MSNLSTLSYITCFQSFKRVDNKLATLIHSHLTPITIRTMRRGSKTSRGSSHSFRYRTISATSDVDETLFGSPKQVSSHLDKCGKSKAKKQQKETQKNQDGETIQIVTKDLIRTLRIPKEAPSGDSIIIPSTEFERITSNSQILTKEEREAQKATHEKKKEEEHKKAEEMKRRMMEIDMSRKQNPLTEEEVEARETQNRLVERANQLQLEEDEEIRTFNQLILNAKCRATCDAQMQEKKLSQAEYLKEEKRLDAMMEAVRRKALENEAQIFELHKQQRISKMQEIHDQIQKRRDDEIIQNEMKEQEKQQIREDQEKMDLEDLKCLEKKKEAQHRLQEEVMRINAETLRAKEQRMEEEKLADMKDMEYNRKKMEREAEYEAEQRRIKKEKDLEIARLRAQQEKAKDRKAEQDELRARRHQESTNREWRRKELELAKKKAQEEAKLKVARLEQVQYKEHFLSMEAGREKAEFERVLKVEQEAILKEKELEEKRCQKARRHAEEMRQQVKERELLAIVKRRETFKEGDGLIKQARQRSMRLNEIKERKLQELKAAGLSEMYCSEVERKARAGLKKPSYFLLFKK